jgi:hypothetical protein
MSPRHYCVYALLTACLSTGLLAQPEATPVPQDFWVAQAADWSSVQTPPAGWSFEGPQALTLQQEADAPARLLMVNRAEDKSKLEIPYPALAAYPQVTIEIRLGATPAAGKGLNWFLKKGDWELRADNDKLYLHNPRTREQVAIGAFAPNRTQTVTLAYNKDDRAIVAAWVDGTPAEGLEPYEADSLSSAGALSLYGTTTSSNEVWFESLRLSADEAFLANLPRWFNPVMGEADTGEKPALPTWEPFAGADELDFTPDPQRLQNPAFERGILFSREDFARLDQALTSDPAMREFWERNASAARRLLKDGRFDLPEEEASRLTYVVRPWLSRLGLLYAATGEPHLGALLRQLILDMAARPTYFWVHSELRTYDPAWPVGQLECAELSRSISLGLNWCPDLFSEEELAYVKAMIRQKGLDPSLRWMEGPGSRAVNNYLAVIGGGGLIAAIAQEDEPAQAVALRTLERWMQSVEPDGSYGEPEGYFQYGFSRFLFGWWALGPERGKALLQDKPLRGSLDWLVTYFILAEHEGVTSAWRVNFGDDDFLTGPKGNTTFTRIVCESLAYAYDDGLGTWISQNLVHPSTPMYLYDFCFRLSCGADKLPAPVSPEQKGLPLARTFDNGVAVIRSGWNFGDDTVFALRSGGAARTRYSHDRPNRNAFVLFAHGDYLAIAPGRASYRNPIHKTWDIPTTSHNTLALDGGNQTRTRVAEFTDFEDTAEWVKVASEAAGSYDSDPHSMLRTVWYVKALDAFVIEDTVDLSRPQVPSLHILLSNFNNQSQLTPLPDEGWKLQRPRANLCLWVEADDALDLTQREGYMHVGYSYFPGGPGEGPEGSALSLTWRPLDPLEQMHWYTLLVPGAGDTTAQVQTDYDDADTPVWTVEKGDLSQRISFKQGPDGKTALVLDTPPPAE